MTPHTSGSPLPARRKSITRDLKWRVGPNEPAFEFTVGIGFGSDGMPCEVFCTGPKAGTMLLAMVDDFCVGISRIHQKDGLTFSELVERLRADIDPVSPLGLVLRTVAKCELCPVCHGERVIPTYRSFEVTGEQPCPSCGGDNHG